MNIEQIAKECKALNTDYAVTFTNEQLEQFAKAIIDAYVAEQTVDIWLTQKEFDTLKRAQKTDRETIPLYALKGETE